MRYLCSVGLGDKDETVLKSLVALLEGKTRQPWNYRDDTHADVVLVDVDNPSTAGTWQSLKGDAGTLRVAYTDRPDFPGARWLLPKPLRAAALVDLLNHLDVATEAENERAPTSEGVSQSSHLELVQLLNRDLDVPMQLSDGQHRLIVDKPSRRYAASHDLEEMHGLCDMPVNRLHLERVDAADDAAAWQPLSQLLWFCALVGSHGQLLQGLDPRGRYRLKRWPNFKQLKHSQEDYRISAFMTRNPAATVDEICEATSVDREHVIGFLNASASCGYLRMEHAQTRVPSTPGHRMPSSRHGLLSMIRTRLGLGQQHHAGT